MRVLYEIMRKTMFFPLRGSYHRRVFEKVPTDRADHYLTVKAGL
jgi:hypothetical protein